MPTIQETLAALRAAAQRGTSKKYKDVRAELLAAQQQLAGEVDLTALPDVSAPLQAAAEGSREVKQIGEQAELALGQLGTVFIHYGQLEEELFPQEVEPGKEVEQPSPPYLIDPETGFVVRGGIVGRISTGQTVALLTELATAGEPMTHRDLSQSLFGDRKGRATGLQGSVRKLLSKTNQRLEAQDLPPVAVSPRRQGYVLGEEYALLGVERRQPPAIEAEAQLGKTPTYSISEVAAELERRGVSGWSSVRIHHLAAELLESGHMTVGSHVMEQFVGSRNLLVYTDEGVDFFEKIGRDFPDFGKIYVDSVRRKIDEGHIAPEPVSEKTGRRFWISQVAQQAKLEDNRVIEELIDLGKLKEGIHYFRHEPTGRRVFEAKALAAIVEFKREVGLEKGSVLTRDHVWEYIEKHPPTKRNGKKSGESSTNAWENPYGKNGPTAVNGDYPEYVLAQKFLDFIPNIEQITGQPVQEPFRLELANRAGELAVKLGIGPHGEDVPEEELPVFSDVKAREIRRGVAATIVHIANVPEAKELRIVEGKRPGVALAHTALRQLVKNGHQDLALKLAKVVAGDNAVQYEVDHSGLVNPPKE